MMSSRLVTTEKQEEMAQLVTSLAKQSGIEIDDEPVKKNQK
jgi:hypothetical protein